MRRPPPARRLVLALTLATPITLAACFGPDEPPPTYAPLRYGYLTPIRLNVASIEVEDHSQPIGPDDVTAQSPAQPAAVLGNMARDRLVAGGGAGTAVFTIDSAAIAEEPNGALDGQLGVHLDILTPQGTRAGTAEARVARQSIPGSQDLPLQTRLYALTRQMMDDMNVEFEFQVRHSLKPWLQTDSALVAPVTATPLNPAATPVAPPSGTPPPYGAAPYGTSPDGGPPDGTAPYGTAPGGTAPTYGAQPTDGSTPSPGPYTPPPYIAPAPGGNAPPVPPLMSPPPGNLALPPGSSSRY